MKNLTGIIIPSGSDSWDHERLRKAFSLGGRDSRYILSGLGPDTNEALEASARGEDVSQYDFHSILWAALRNKHLNGETGIFGAGITAVNTEGNLKECFPPEKETLSGTIEGQTGNYAWVSFPGHNWRTRLIEQRLKLEGEMSRDVTIIYVDTKPVLSQSPQEMVYGLAGAGKELLMLARSYVLHKLRK